MRFSGKEIGLKERFEIKNELNQEKDSETIFEILKSYDNRQKKQLSYLVGALADGSLYQNEKHYVNRVTFFQKHKEYLECNLKPLIKGLFGVTGHYYYDKRKDVWFLEITSKKVYQTMNELAWQFKSKGDREIPKWIMQNKICHADFIRSFFETDGWYRIDTVNNDFRVGFGQSEQKVLEDLNLMLEQLQFKTSKVLGPYQSKKGVKPYFELHIHGLKQIFQFNKLIRPNHPKKIQDFDRILEYVRTQPKRE